MLAEKVLLTYPIAKGVVRIGEEYTSSKIDNNFNTEYVNLNSAISKITEDNTVCFMEVMQQLDKFVIGAGLRYEHVSYDYFERRSSVLR